MQLVNEILLFYFWPFFVSLSHVPLPQNPASSASSSLSLKIEHIGDNFRGIILAQQLVWVNHQMIKKFSIKRWYIAMVAQRLNKK